MLDNVHFAHSFVKANCTPVSVQIAQMTDDLLTPEAKRVRLARERAGYKTAKAAAKRFGWSYNTYAQYENGTRGISQAARDLARAFKVSLGWLLTGQGEIDTPIVAITGRVGAATDGEVIQSNADSYFGQIRAPFQADPDTVAVEVSGGSMGALADGSVVFYSVRHPEPLPDMLGYPIVVGLFDGRVLLKELLRGSRTGLWDLRSVNGPILADQDVEWFAHIDYIVPPWRARLMKLDHQEVPI